MKRIITGLQPTNFLHIGNYFGAIEPAVAMQEGNNLRIFIPDYHAITVPQDPAALRKNILFATATYLACGIDPKRTLVFQQSRVPAHTELAWVLQCVTKMGEAERMIQYKDKAVGKGESVSVGLFTYPILMAADILLYDTDLVPVGEDQKQHVELTRDIAIRFNRGYGDTFVVPQPQIRKEGARIMGLDDPEMKMSKSASSPKNYLSLLDDEAVLRKKIMSAVTDKNTEIRTDRNRPGITNLLTLFSLVSGRPIEKLETEFAGKGYGEFKTALADATVALILPIQQRIHEYLTDETQLISILDNGAARANELAEKKIAIVRKRLGVNL